jgi:histone deacetylase 6
LCYVDVIHIPPRRAIDEEVLLIHDPVHLDFIKSIPAKPQNELNKMAERLDSIYINPDTYDCALLSAGSLLAVVDTVCQVLTVVSLLLLCNMK